MKLALCLSGQPRSYVKVFDYLKKNLLDPYDVDIFIHSWKLNNYQQNTFEYVTGLYGPVSIFFDKELPNTINSDMIVPNASHPANFCTSMFYSIYRSNDFRIRHQTLNDVKYDYVIRSRFDFALNKVIDFNSLERGKLYIPKDTDGPNPLLNDQFAIADPDTMNVYASTFLNLRQLYNSGVPLCGHEMLQEQLLRNSIPVERIDVPSSKPKIPPYLVFYSK